METYNKINHSCLENDWENTLAWTEKKKTESTTIQFSEINFEITINFCSFRVHYFFFFLSGDTRFGFPRNS